MVGLYLISLKLATLLVIQSMLIILSDVSIF